jgi:hypothetical protein
LDGAKQRSGTAGYRQSRRARHDSLKHAQDSSQKKKTNTADTSQQQQGGKKSFWTASVNASTPWKNDSKFKAQRKGHQKKAKTSDSEFDIFS